MSATPTTPPSQAIGHVSMCVCAHTCLCLYLPFVWRVAHYKTICCFDTKLANGFDSTANPRWPQLTRTTYTHTHTHSQAHSHTQSSTLSHTVRHTLSHTNVIMRPLFVYCLNRISICLRLFVADIRIPPSLFLFLVYVFVFVFAKGLLLTSVCVCEFEWALKSKLCLSIWLIEFAPQQATASWVDDWFGCRWVGEAKQLK